MSDEIEIDGVKYDLNNLSDDAKVQIALVRFTDLKLREIFNTSAPSSRKK